MRDFLNFELTEQGFSQSTVLWAIKHKTRDRLVVEFTTPTEISAVHFKAVFIGALMKYAQKYGELARSPMTAAQKAYYDKLVEFHRMEGRAPSYEEQCYMLGVKSKGTPHHYAKTLEKAGWVWIDGRSVIPYEIAEPSIEEA